MESFRRDILNDKTEHRPIMKYNQNTYYPRFTLLNQNRQHTVKQVVLFYCLHLMKKENEVAFQQ